ncbi:MAG: phage tail protein [Candidatus Yonathbacteria bacterium]|nr:phage tail protein [Candidatus Yonathbacteria bacterium]
MRHNTINTLKISSLALVLSFGLSYVYAWMAPTVTPPGGNVSAPINTSATLQQKNGDFTVQNFLANTMTVGGTINANAITAPSFCIGTSCINAWPGVPAGAVLFFNLASCPTGWLPANGTSGTPDLRGEFARGLDSGRGVDAGRTLGSAQADMLKSHTHSLNSGVWNGTGPYAEPPVGSYSSFTGATGGTETRPRNVALLACIKS